MNLNMTLYIWSPLLQRNASGVQDGYKQHFYDILETNCSIIKLNDLEQVSQNLHDVQLNHLVFSRYPFHPGVKVMVRVTLANQLF